MKGLLAVSLLAVGSVASVKADELAHWTFETSIPATAGPHAAEAGVFAATSFASGLHATGATVYSNPSGNGSLESFSSNEWSIGDYYEFETSTTGYTAITVSWSQTRSSTGPGSFEIHGSIDGTTYLAIPASAYTVLENSAANGGFWNSTTHIAAYDFGPIGAAAADNLAVLGVRLVCTAAPAGNLGTNRVDDFRVEGTLIPALRALTLLALSGLTVIRRRR